MTAATNTRRAVAWCRTAMNRPTILICVIASWSGYRLFNAKDPQNPMFDIRVRAAKHESDMFYINRCMRLIEDAIVAEYARRLEDIEQIIVRVQYHAASRAVSVARRRIGVKARQPRGLGRLLRVSDPPVHAA